MDRKPPEFRPPPSQPLNYARPHYSEPRRLGGLIEGIIGFLSYFAAAGLMYAMLQTGSGVALGIGLPAVLLLAATVFAAAYGKWYGFPPGVLIGLGTSCLVGGITVFALCGGFK